MAFRLLTVLSVSGAAFACGGSGSYTAPSSSTPTTTTSPGNAVTVSIVATAGNNSYVPNPVATAGSPVVFRNDDKVTHHIVMDDGSGDWGTLTPGASSAAKTVSGGNFHCTIHPSMVGSVNGATAPTPAPGSGNGY